MTDMVNKEKSRALMESAIDGVLYDSNRINEGNRLRALARTLKQDGPEAIKATALTGAAMAASVGTMGAAAGGARGAAAGAIVGGAVGGLTAAALSANELRKAYKKNKDYMDHTEVKKKTVKEDVLTEGLTEKHFILAAKTIALIKNPEDRKKAAKEHAELYKKANPKFSHSKFYDACNVYNGSDPNFSGMKSSNDNTKKEIR